MRKILQVAVKNDENFYFIVGKKGFSAGLKPDSIPNRPKTKRLRNIIYRCKQYNAASFRVRFFKLSVFTAGPSKYP